MIVAEHKDVLVINQPSKSIIATPGSRGPAGPIGAVDPDLFFQTLNKLSELDTEQKKADARENLGVQVFDCGEFF